MTFQIPIWSEKLGYTALLDRQLIASIFQPGVMAGNDLKCAASTGFTSSIEGGRGAVEGNNVTQQGLYVVQNTGPVVVTHGSPSTSFPRIDQIGVKVYDSTDGGDSSDGPPAPLILEGTPTSGANLTNRSGAVTSLPKNFLRLFDVLVPVSAASAASFTYRDRRSWSRGALAASTNVTMTGELNPKKPLTEMQLRIESLGAPLLIQIVGKLGMNRVSGSGYIHTTLYLEDNGGGEIPMLGGQNPQFEGPGSAEALESSGILGQWLYTPTAGSHLFLPSILSGANTHCELDAVLLINERVVTTANNGTS
jgi:hypothetical protein